MPEALSTTFNLGSYWELFLPFVPGSCGESKQCKSQRILWKFPHCLTSFWLKPSPSSAIHLFSWTFTFGLRICPLFHLNVKLSTNHSQAMKIEKKKLLSQSEIRKIPKTQSLLKLILVYSVSVLSLEATALVAQWIARSTLERGVRGSIPCGGRTTCTILLFSFLLQFCFLQKILRY